ncbi:hypothetical protein LIER_41568 [Lithospermum erythrorhizon]|uniref:Aminotransferase-like plant mobile domain-containing protein n=1 Tax=Lithospermum erythrorhizon TaxID=34254 RepID=A0AAV3RDB8_LITER
MWTPYGVPGDIPPASLFHGCLRFMDYVEEYMHDRVTRQFRRVQGIPRRAISMGRKTRLAANGKSYKKEYGHADEYWEQIAQYTYTLRDLGREARIDDHTSPEYIQWYAMITHPRVHNPNHGPKDVYVGTMHTASQHRLQPIRQKLFSVSQQALEDPNVQDYVRASLHNMNPYASTGGFPGVHPRSMHHWWGQPNMFPEEQYRQLVQQGWSASPGYEYENLSTNPDDENSE